MRQVVDLTAHPASPFRVVERWADLQRDLLEVPMLSWQARHYIFSPGSPLPDPRPFPTSPKPALPLTLPLTSTARHA